MLAANSSELFLAAIFSSAGLVAAGVMLTRPKLPLRALP